MQQKIWWYFNKVKINPWTYSRDMGTRLNQLVEVNFVWVSMISFHPSYIEAPNKGSNGVTTLKDDPSDNIQSFPFAWIVFPSTLSSTSQGSNQASQRDPFSSLLAPSPVCFTNSLPFLLTFLLSHIKWGFIQLTITLWIVKGWPKNIWGSLGCVLICWDCWDLLPSLKWNQIF